MPPPCYATAMMSHNIAAEISSLQVDDLYFFALSASSDEELFPISDDKYAGELQLQEVLFSSAVAAALNLPPPPPPNDAIKHVGESSSSSSRVASYDAIKHVGKSSSYSCVVFCKICMDVHPASEMLSSAAACSHSFCRDCLGRYVAGNVRESVGTITCPEVSCRAPLDHEVIQGLVPREVFDRWLDLLAEAAIMALRWLRCPFEDCSALLLDDDDDSPAGPLRQAECQNCWRMFCAQCKVAWHAGLTCEEFGRLSKGENTREDVMLMQAAKMKKWQRCPKCRFFVEKAEGCNHVTCRCRYEFCYLCGSKWTVSHGC